MSSFQRKKNRIENLEKNGGIRSRQDYEMCIELFYTTDYWIRKKIVPMVYFYACSLTRCPRDAARLIAIGGVQCWQENPQYAFYGIEKMEELNRKEERSRKKHREEIDYCRQNIQKFGLQIA